MENLLVHENYRPYEDRTYWEIEKDGEIIRIGLEDIYPYLSEEMEIDPNEIKSLLIRTKRDRNRINNADLSYPIIIATRGSRPIRIIDGNHRVVKAIRKGSLIKVRILDLKKNSYFDDFFGF